MENFEIEFNNAFDNREKCINAKKTCDESFIKYMEELALDVYCRYYKFWNDHNNILKDEFYLDIINIATSISGWNYLEICHPVQKQCPLLQVKKMTVNCLLK